MKEYFLIKDGGLVEYLGPKDEDSVVIPEGVVTIAKKAFSAVQYSLRKITMPNSLKTIQGSAFANFYQLEEVHLPETLQAVPEGCFCNWKKLCPRPFTQRLSHKSKSQIQCLKSR